MSTTAAPLLSITQKLVVPFVNAVRDVFQKMANVKVTVGRPHMKSQNSPTYDICGIIGFSGEVSGSVTLNFSDEAASKLIESFAGMKIERDAPDFADAVGELANMVAGSAKASLGATASISLPSVLIGKFTVANMSGAPCLVIPCSSPHGEFSVEICSKPKGN